MAAYFFLNAIQQGPVGFAGSTEGHHGQQLGLLTHHTFLRREKSQLILFVAYQDIHEIL